MEVECVALDVQDHPQLHKDFEANLVMWGKMMSVGFFTNTETGMVGNEERTDTQKHVHKSWDWVFWALGWRSHGTSIIIQLNREVGLLQTKQM